MTAMPHADVPTPERATDLSHWGRRWTPRRVSVRGRGPTSATSSPAQAIKVLELTTCFSPGWERAWAEAWRWSVICCRTHIRRNR